MKALASLIIFVVCIVFAINYWDEDKADPVKQTTQTTETEQNTTQSLTIQDVLKENQKQIASIKGYKFTRVLLEKRNGKITSNTTENGEEQLNPQIAHFTNESNIEYYYDQQTVYRKVNGQWQKKQNTDGKVLVSISFTNNIKFLIQNIGTSTIPPTGITMEQNASGDYVITIDYLIFKDPTITDSEFQQQKLQVKTRQTKLTINGKTFEPMKYIYEYETFDGQQLRSVDMDLRVYNEPISIPFDVTGYSSNA
jgi:hypothetical protein